MVDKENLEKTFGGCDFEIQNHRDLNQSSMDKLLNNLNTDKGLSEYECIIMCILSHGIEGNF